MRYQAPQHTSGVFAPSREYRADDDGVIELPDEAPDSDHAAMRAAGCVTAQDPVADTSAASKVKPAKAEPEVEAPAVIAEQPKGAPED